MKTIKKGDRVQSKANPLFCGVVVETSKDGKNGYVHFDSDTEQEDRTFFDVSELEPEHAKPV